MGSDVAALDSDRVLELADRVAEAAVGVDAAQERLNRMVGGWGLLSIGLAFGNTDNADGCFAAYGEASSAGTAVAEGLGKVLKSDDGRLRETVSCFEQLDANAADSFCLARGDTLDILTTHTQAGTSDEDEAHRTDQLDTAVNELLTAEPTRIPELPTPGPGPTIFTGDLNVDVHEDGDTDSAREVQRLEDGGFVNAGVDAGPTHDSGQIDYVWTSPDLHPGEPRVVTGDRDTGESFSSDHDGILLDVEIPPRW